MIFFPKRHEVRRVLLTYIGEEGVGRGIYEGARPEGPRDGGSIRPAPPPVAPVVEGGRVPSGNPQNREDTGFGKPK